MYHDSRALEGNQHEHIGLLLVLGVADEEEISDRTHCLASVQDSQTNSLPIVWDKKLEEKPPTSANWLKKAVVTFQSPKFGLIW